MNYQFIDESATILKVIVGTDELLFKKVYCSTSIEGDYFILNTHEYESSIYRQEFRILYSDSINPVVASASALQTSVDAIINNYAGGGTSGSGITHFNASGTDTYTATVSGVTSYTDGDAYLVQFTNGNTTTATLNINSLGAIPLYRNNDGQIIGGDIQNNAMMLVVYNSGLNVFQCVGTSPNTIISYVTNGESVTITKGQAVYAFGGVGDRMKVKLAYNTTDATSAQTVGLVMSSSIAANQKGFIIMQGLLDGLSILPTSTYADGDTIYLGSTAGTITKTKPYAPNHLVYLGVVTTASPGSAGRMYVKVQNGYELDELHNVQAQSPTNKDTIYYDSASNQWKTASLATILGYTPVTNARTISTTSPLSGGGDLSADRTLSIADAVADGTTKGAATFNASDFNSASGVISLDYTNGQAASSSNKGFLTSADWTTFNSKGNGTVTSVAALTLGTTGTDLSSSVATGTTTPVITLNVPTASATNRGVLSAANWSTFNGKQDALVSGTNIKTINGSSVLGSGNLTISGSGLTQATWLTTVQALGSSIKCEPVAFGHGSQLTTTATLTTQVLSFWAVYVPVATTITGVMYYITNGNSVSTVTTGFNGMGLYTLSGTTLTRVAVTADAVANWRSGGATATQKIPFTSTYSAAAGVYYIGLLACITGTLPSIRSASSGTQSVTWSQYDTNVFAVFQSSPQTTMPTTITATATTPINIYGSYLY